MPHRVQLSRRKGWRLPPDTVSVARPRLWGNPYSVAEFGSLAVPMFAATVRGERPGEIWPEHAVRTDALHDAWMVRIGGHPGRRAMTELQGKHLACWCRLDGPCHADVLLEVANPESEGTALG